MPPTPATWDGKDAQGNPLRWDTPGLTWDGFIPQPQPTGNKGQSDPSLSLVPPAVWTLVPTFFDPAGTAAAKADAVLAASSNNTNAVATLDTPFANDPPTLADLEVLRAKQNEVIFALRR